MSRRAVYCNDDLINDFAIQMLPRGQFFAKFVAAVGGEQNEFSKFIRVREERRVFTAAWKGLRSFVFERDDFTCRYCGARGGKLECDHVVPASRGGSDDLSNLVTACRPCNRSKRNKTPEEWLR